MACDDFNAPQNRDYAYSSVGRVVFYGDSITQGLYDEAVSQNTFGQIPLVDLAIVGSGLYAYDASTLRNNVSQINSGDLVIVSIGVNDAETARRSEDSYMDALRGRLQSIQAQGGRIALLGLDAENSVDLSRYPLSECFARENLNENLYALSQELGIQFIDRSEIDLRTPSGQGDGLHPKDPTNPSANDYGPMLDLIKEHITITSRAALNEPASAPDFIPT